MGSSLLNPITCAYSLYVNVFVHKGVKRKHEEEMGVTDMRNTSCNEEDSICIFPIINSSGCNVFHAKEV